MQQMARACVLLFFVTGCNTGDSEVEADESFLKIYDDKRFNESYIPLDIQQTRDGGYLVLSGTRIAASNFVGIRILRLDKEGNFVSQFTMDPGYVHPVGNLMKSGEGFFFFCMDAVSLQANLVRVSGEDGKVSAVTPIPNVHYPLHASLPEENFPFILQSYSSDSKETLLSLVNTEGSVARQQGFAIGAGDEVEKPIIEHFTRTGKQLPFLAGQTSGGLYYFNGFYNYTFSLVFTGLSNGEPSGVVQGQQDKGGISALLPLTGNSFALSRFNFGDNYFLPGAEIDRQGISSSINLTGFSMPELKNDARVILKRVVTKGVNILLYGSTTKNGQIILMAYDEVSGDLKGTEYLGFSYPYEIAGFVQTEDGGLAVAALTQVAGRFPRICLFKLSKKELEAITG